MKATIIHNKILPKIQFASLILIAVLLTVSTNSKAVNISPNETAQVIIFPYYSVNNNLLTLASIVSVQTG